MSEKIILVKIFIFLNFPFIVCANDFCHNLSVSAIAKGVHFDNADNVYKVVGKGRLQFYLAPNKRCVDKGVFVIPGNDLYAYVEFDNYYSVMFITHDGDQVTGWVEKERLKETNTGIAPDYNDGN